MEANGVSPEDSEHQSIKLETSSDHIQQTLALNRLSKSSQILEACKWSDKETLRALAVSELGLVSDEIRRQAWPILLGTIDNGEFEAVINRQGDWRSLTRHADEDQIQLDVNRSFIYYPRNQTEKELHDRKEQLSDLIVEVLRRQPYLCYFQGYHDICQVFLLVLDPPHRTNAVARLSALRIRDFMLPSMSAALAQLRLIPAILHAVDPKLWRHLSQTQPFFALSGTLTMYAHDIQEYGDIARLFDALLAREAVFSVYMFAQIVLQRSEELFDTPSDEPEMLHSILSKLPTPLNLELLISNTVKLIERHPPESLQGWWSISRSSVLKTTLKPDQAAAQTLRDGEIYFQRQVKDLEWAERRQKLVEGLWKYKRPASTIGLAVIVGVLSMYLRKSSGVSAFCVALRRWMNI